MAHSESVTPSKILFQPFKSVLNPGFWQKLTNLKLDHLKLSEEPIEIHGTYSFGLSDKLPCLASFDQNSFCDPNSIINAKSTCPLYGELICTNILQEFVGLDTKSYLDRLGDYIWKSVCDGRALSDPEKYLSRFGVIVHADLKKYKFYYWFSFPAINYPQNVHLLDDQAQCQFTTITQLLSAKSIDKFQALFDNNPETFGSRSYFVVKHSKKEGAEDVTLHRLSEASNCLNDCTSEIYFAYSDPASNQSHPGWVLRNYLCLIAVQFQLDTVNMMRLRKSPKSTTTSNSLMNVDINQSTVFRLKLNLHSKPGIYKLNAVGDVQYPACPTITGWERNESQQLKPEVVDLSELLDPKKLASDAVNLNLRLMKWRLLPNLNLDKIAETKCLLLGCGTLGCHIARGLLAWGIKNLSLVDNAKISYSNPVRQSLYTFEDCARGKSAKMIYKAEAAATALRRIHPTVNVQSHVLSIPMPGHNVGQNEIESVRQDVANLEELIEQHDAIFLLMDTRESRWLPSVIALAQGKLVINAAIGFDTFLLQRYGVRTEDPEQRLGSSHSGHRNPILSSSQLGCYFCNDIVAPGDTTVDRTLDQQCTVSRPGVSMMVSAMAVELLVSIISSPMGILTPAVADVRSDDDELFDSDLGIVPHTVRCNLSRFHVYMPTCPAFSKCSACSPEVIESYKRDGFNFLLRVFNDPTHLEDLTGLRDLQNVDEDNVQSIPSEDEDDAIVLMD